MMLMPSIASVAANQSMKLETFAGWHPCVISLAVAKVVKTFGSELLKLLTSFATIAPSETDSKE